MSSTFSVLNLPAITDLCDPDSARYIHGLPLVSAWIMRAWSRRTSSFPACGSRNCRKTSRVVAASPAARVDSQRRIAHSTRKLLSSGCAWIAAV